ncbi:MAG TPA: polar localization protein TipN [Caulobacteraceae bacterium]|nr:polar localization protein TipN [Caulobacteraceae bacterium]
MSKKHRPLNFSDPDFAEAPPPGLLDDAMRLEAPPMPGRSAPVAAASRKTTSAPAAAPTGAKAQDLAAFAPVAHKRGAEVPSALLYLLAAAATVLWSGGLAAFAFGYRSRLGPFAYEPFAATVLAIVALAPIGLIWIGAFALRQGLMLLGETRRLRALSDEILGPAALAAAHTGSTVDSIRVEVDSALQTMSQARAQLLQLRHGLAEEVQRLFEAVGHSERAGAVLVKSLGHERQGFSALSGKLEVQASEVSEIITRHARMVAEASDLAQTQIQEAEAALAARAADLAAAAGEATDAARIAGDDLSRQAVRLEAAGVTVGDQVRTIEENLSQQRAALVALSHTLRTDQEDLAVNFESLAAQLEAILRQSEHQSQSLSTAALSSADVLRRLIDEAAQQLRDMSDQAQTERDLLGGAALQSLGAFSEAAAFERRALEEETQRAINTLSVAAEHAHKAAESASEAAKRKVEQLSEAAFEAGQKADAAFDDRLDQAHALIQRSVELIDDAAVQSMARLDRGVEAAKAALDDLQRGLAQIEAREARLPADAAERGEQIKAALDEATRALLDSARAASAELQAIDTAFQDRVKRNYEMLSEAVRLMSVIGTGAASRASGGPAPAPRAPPLLRPRVSESAEPSRSADAGSGAGLGPGLGDARRRLKLTPTETDDALKTVFEPAGERAGGEADLGADGWSWTELLTSLGGEEAAQSEDGVEESLVAEIRALGIDPVALLPEARLDEIATAIEIGDLLGAREAAHRLAPAAIRKLARRVMSDKLLRAQADRFVQQQAARLNDAVRRGQTRVALARGLASDAGRAYVLFDAAVGDLN